MPPRPRAVASRTRSASDGWRPQHAAGDDIDATARSGCSPESPSRSGGCSWPACRPRSSRAARPAGGAAARPGGNAAHWVRVIPDLVAHAIAWSPPTCPARAPPSRPTAPLGAERVLAWLDELIERDLPVAARRWSGYALGGAIAARFAAAGGDRLGALVLVDALGLAAVRARAGVRRRAARLSRRSPSEPTHDACGGSARSTSTACARHMGERWEPFEACNLDAPRTPRVLAGLGSLMEQFGMPAIPADDLERIAVPTTLIWGRHDLATPVRGGRGGERAPRLAAAGDRGLRRRSAGRAAGRVPARAARGAGRPRATLAAAGFGGEVVDRGHPRYDELRAVFNGMIDRRPALIARCGDAADVSAAVRFARDRDLPVSVYGGGHNVTGNAVCDDGVTIDLRPMKGIEVDPEARTCRAEAGLTWGELDAATQEHGLAVTGGRVSTTGLGGLALGGGSGWIERACGYTVDNLLSVEIVTADGEIVTASETREPGPVLGHARRWRQPRRGDRLRAPPASDRPDRAGRDAHVPRDDGGRRAAQLPRRDGRRPRRGRLGRLPAHGAARGVRARAGARQPVVGVVVCYAGPVEEGEEALRPLREFGPPGARHGRTDAVRGAAAAHRPRLPRRACATTGPATSSPGFPTRRSTSCAASTSRRPRR